MRRVLRKIAAHEESELGDTSTLAVRLSKKRIEMQRNGVGFRQNQHLWTLLQLR